MHKKDWTIIINMSVVALAINGWAELQSQVRQSAGRYILGDTLTPEIIETPATESVR